MADTAGRTVNGNRWLQGGPPTPVLATSFFLAGLGTVVLGPLLPQLLAEWQLTDQRGGYLLLAKFVGAFVGGATVPRFLRLGIVLGHLVAGAGFALFATAHGLAVALPALALTGIGLGEIIASTNILAGRRWSVHTGSALALLNFFWSLGAISTGLLIAALLPLFGWRGPVLTLASLFATTGALTGLSSGRDATAPFAPAPSPSLPASDETGMGTLARFGALLFLYGGLETCLTAWLTTFSFRIAGGHVLGGQSGFVVLWTALTAGRLLASAAMRRLPEPLVQRWSLGFCLLLIIALSLVHSTGSLALVCIVLGVALAPVFPSTFALLLRHPVSPRLAGLLLAGSGLGAALFPALMGVLSTATGSLRLAMAVPGLLIPFMLLLTLGEADRSAPISTAAHIG